MGKNNARKTPLQCRKCNGTILPDEAICTPNGIWVLRYMCIKCDCRWYPLKNKRHWVLVEATTSPRAIPTPSIATGDDDNNARPAIAA